MKFDIPTFLKWRKPLPQSLGPSIMASHEVQGKQRPVVRDDQPQLCNRGPATEMIE